MPAAIPEPGDFVRRYLPSVDVAAARSAFLADPREKKNVLVAYESRGEEFVLKIFRHGLRHRLQVLKNPVSRFVTRAFTIRSGARARAQSEIDCSRSFRDAGFGTFEIVTRPAPHALVFRRCAGLSLRDHLSAVRRDEALVGRYVERLAGDLSRRQAEALRREDLHLVHPTPRVHHAWLTPDEQILYFDFEDRVNPHLRVAEALALELESFFFYVLRFAPAAREENVRRAARVIDDVAFDRWRAHAAQRGGGNFSGSARRRRGLLERILALRA